MAVSAAQQFLVIDAIREDTVILKNAELRVILMCSALNFALKSTDEQDAIIFQYQNFLNSLDFSLQILVQSRRLNIAPYLEQIRERQKEDVNELLKLQISEYAEFIKTFVEMSDIMAKTFYVVVPFTPAVLSQGGGFSNFLNIFRSSNREAQEQAVMAAFEENRNQVWQRVDTVVSGLQHFGIRAAPLNTEELIELFYGLYNPTEFEKTAS